LSTNKQHSLGHTPALNWWQDLLCIDIVSTGSVVKESVLAAVEIQCATIDRRSLWFAPPSPQEASNEFERQFRYHWFRPTQPWDSIDMMDCLEAMTV